MRGRKVRAGMAYVMTFGKKRNPPCGQNSGRLRKKNEIPLAGQTRADGKRHKTRKKRKIKQQEEELSDNIRFLRLAPAAFVPLMFPVRGLKSGFRSARALWRPDFSPSGRRPEVKWTERSEV